MQLSNAHVEVFWKKETVFLSLVGAFEALMRPLRVSCSCSLPGFRKLGFYHEVLLRHTLHVSGSSLIELTVD